MLLGEHGELPPEGTAIRLGEYVFEILEIRRNRIESVLVKRAPVDADAEQPSAGSTESAADIAPGESPAGDTVTPVDPGHTKEQD